MKARTLSILAVSMAFGAALAARGGDPQAEPGSKMAGQVTHIAKAASDIQWGDAPPSVPAGAKFAVLEGDPAKAGFFTIRLKTPDGYRIAPHWHPTDEHLTIISGTFHLGMGDKFDEASGTALPAGSYASTPAKMRHYAWTTGETEVQVSGMGPFQINYVNPADDPRKAAK